MKKITIDDDKYFDETINTEYLKELQKTIDQLQRNALSLELDHAKNNFIHDQYQLEDHLWPKQSVLQVYTNRTDEEFEIDFSTDGESYSSEAEYVLTALNEIFYQKTITLENFGIKYEQFFQLNNNDPYLTLTQANFESEMNKFFNSLIHLIDPNYIKEKEFNMMQEQINTQKLSKPKNPKL